MCMRCVFLPANTTVVCCGLSYARISAILASQVVAKLTKGDILLFNQGYIRSPKVHSGGSRNFERGVQQVGWHVHIYSAPPSAVCRAAKW